MFSNKGGDIKGGENFEGIRTDYFDNDFPHYKDQ